MSRFRTRIVVIPGTRVTPGHSVSSDISVCELCGARWGCTMASVQPHRPDSERLSTMALAAQLLPGFQYEIVGGPLEGEVVTIVDNKPFPDGDPQGRQRKITVQDPFGGEVYILPRL